MSPSWPQIVAGTSSVIARLSTYTFLRWIPGHHFPPIVLLSVAVYLVCVFSQSKAFGEPRPTLSEAFRKLIGKPKRKESVAVVNTKTTNDDHDEPTLYDDEKVVLKTLGLGVPDWSEPEYSYISVAINVLMAFLTLDLVFRGPLLHPVSDLSFSRVGFVDSTSAKVILREPDSSQLPVYAYIRSLNNPSWTTTDRIYNLDADTDYTYQLTFTGLLPDTKYVYCLSNDFSGSFTTAPAPYSTKDNSLTFLTTSCIKANFPYRPFSHSLAIHGFESLSTVVQSLLSPAAFMLFLGDFIYVDVPLRLSASYEHYRSEYRRVYASPSWSLPGVASMPWLHTIDDHEIANDWSGGNETAPFPAASDPFTHYHASTNPPLPSSLPKDVEANTTYFQFTRGPASIFMLDTRRYRTSPEPQTTSTHTTKPLYGSCSTTLHPPPPTTNHTMLGPTQLTSLLTFLTTPAPPTVHFYIIASSVPFTKNWRFGTSDTWGGFLTERALILDAMHAAERDLGVRVIILSGDRHEFAAIRYPPAIASFAAPRSDRGRTPSVADIVVPDVDSAIADQEEIVYDRTPDSGPHEFSCGPLSMFYLPFRTFKQVDGGDVAVKYVPDGNSKVGVVDIQNLGGMSEGGQKSLLRYSLWVDGVLSWEYVVMSPGPGAKGREGGGCGKGLGLWR